MGSSSDSEKIIQRLNDELREVQEQANTEKHKCMELQGENGSLWYGYTLTGWIQMCTFWNFS